LIWLILAYPLLTHAAIWLQRPSLQWLALTALIAIALYDALQKRRAWAWCTLPALSAALLGIVSIGGGMFVLYVPPILLPAALLVLFARSLRSESIPLITRFATAARGKLPDDLATYTRSVTIVWTCTLALLVLSATLSAWLATPAVWSLLTNFVHYAALGALFLIEYVVRRLKFRHLEHPGFVAYVRLLFVTRIRAV